MSSTNDGIETVRVELDARSYDIVIGRGLIDRAGTMLRPVIATPRVAVVTDNQVGPLYSTILAASLEQAEAIAEEIYAARDFEDKPVITVTGHTHIDVAWLWRVRETRQKMARSMSTALALMEQYPAYRFM